MPDEYGPEEFAGMAELSLRMAVKDLASIGMSPTEIANLVSDTLFKTPEVEYAIPIDCPF